MINETEVKYLAGLLDADGYFGFEFRNNRVFYSLILSAATSIDRFGYVLSLPERTGFGSSHVKSQRIETWAPITAWKVTRARDIEMLLPRLVKHLVIKGAHAQRLFDLWQAARGQDLSELEIEQLKAASKASRNLAGPLKPRKHPSWAWVAGYLDGDGSYMNKKSSGQLLVQATAHVNDRVSLDLLHKAFGGHITTRGKNGEHILDWRHGFGKTQTAFAKKFLGKMVQHSRLKKHKIEEILSIVNQRTCTD